MHAMEDLHADAWIQRGWDTEQAQILVSVYYIIIFRYRNRRL